MNRIEMVSHHLGGITSAKIRNVNIEYIQKNLISRNVLVKHQRDVEISNTY